MNSVWASILVGIIIAFVMYFIVEFISFFIDVPKQLKRIADELEKLNKDKEKK